MKRIEAYKEMLAKFFPVDETIHNSFLFLHLEELFQIFEHKDKLFIQLELNNYKIKTLSLLPMLKSEYKKEITVLREISDVVKLIIKDLEYEIKITS
ncbi:MAG: hypothetical protein HXY50_09770 [Ignavibacteriaceae bacterium]|nr:hypothetical protein [Ignavibacteriaceae bacterium]